MIISDLRIGLLILGITVAGFTVSNCRAEETREVKYRSGGKLVNLEYSSVDFGVTYDFISGRIYRCPEGKELKLPYNIQMKRLALTPKDQAKKLYTELDRYENYFGVQRVQDILRAGVELFDFYKYCTVMGTNNIHTAMNFGDRGSLSTSLMFNF